MQKNLLITGSGIKERKIPRTAIGNGGISPLLYSFIRNEKISQWLNHPEQYSGNIANILL